MATKTKAPAKRTVSIALSAPEVFVYIADDFREEKRGTFTAVGLHTARAVTLDVPPHAVVDQQHPLAIHSLSFLVSLRGFLGETKITFGFETATRPGALISSRSQVHNFKTDKEVVNLIVRGQPFLFHEFGLRSIVVDIGDYRHVTPFEIIRRTPSKPAN